VELQLDQQPQRRSHPPLQGKMEFVKMDKETLIEFRKTTKTYLDEVKAKYPDVKKVLDSQEAFIADFADWRDARSGVTPWPYDQFVGGRTTE
jgi:TRAP-type mannitol/chloroaromatic compound transport system substrate-binding protein